MRLSVLHIGSAAIAIMAIICGCNTLRLEEYGRNPEDAWLTEGGSVSRSYAGTRAPSLPLEIDWDYNASAAFGPGGPLIVGQYVVVGTRKGEIHAIDIDRGKKVGVEDFGEVINGSPTADGSVLYVPVAWGRKTGIVAYELRSASRLWRYEAPPVTTGILVAGSSIVFADETPVVRALAPDGSVRWESGLDDESAVTTTPLLAGNSVVSVADSKGRVYGLRLSDGTAAWRVDLADPVYTSMASRGDTIYVPTTRAALYALDAGNGRLLWRFAAEDDRARLATPAIATETLVVGASDGSVTALDRVDGSVRWTWATEGAITAAPVVAGEYVIVGTMRATVHALSLSTGEELWSTEVEGRVKSAPVTTGSAVFILAEPRHVIRFSSREIDLAEAEH